MNITAGEAAAQAIRDAGVKVATCVPGSGGTEIFESFRNGQEQLFPYSYHEETAYGIAHGVALTGSRSVSLMKSHGILKAGNAVSDSLFTGTTAGLLTIVLTDAAGSHSDSILDIKPFLTGIGIPWQEASIQSVYQQIFDLIRQSEASGLPQVLVMDAADASTTVSPPRKQTLPISYQPYRRDITRHVLCPFFSRYQYEVLQGRYQHSRVDEIAPPALPTLPNDVPERWQSLIEEYSPLFAAFRDFRGTIVTGDTGISSLFACEPYQCIDITTYMGGSIPLATGALLGGSPDAWAVTGDFAFLSAGHLGLFEVLQRSLPVKILLLRNGNSATTGGQPLHSAAMESLLADHASHTLTIHDPKNEEETRRVFNHANQCTDFVIVVADFEQRRS